MVCSFCGDSHFQITYEDRSLSPYLPDVILVGIRKDTCLACGEYEIEIPFHHRLMEIVAIALLNKKWLLAPGEIRWLRSRLGLTATQLAGILKVSPTTISYWENGQRNPSATADLALRFLIMFTLPPGTFSPEASPLIATTSHAPLQIHLQYDDSGWFVLESKPILVDLRSAGTTANAPLWGSWPRVPATG